MDKTVTLTDPEWQQLVAILANATGYLVLNKLIGQLQAQEPEVVPPKGDGLDQSGELPLSSRAARATGPGR